MALKIIHASDPVDITRSIILIYGQPGVGKTSLAFTAQSPFLLDFDGGAHRSGFRKDMGRMTSWKDVANLRREDFAGYKTLIIDTADTCLSYLAEQVMSEAERNRMSSGGLTLQGYGALKTKFGQWLMQLTQWGLDIILIAHAKEDKENDVIRLRPLIMGGSYDLVIQKSDFIGYMHKVNDRSTLCFSPTEKWYGKNSAGLPVLTIPDFTSEPNYFAGIIDEMKQALARDSNAQLESKKRLEAIKEEIQAIKDCDGLNTFAQRIKDNGFNIEKPERLTVFGWLKEYGEKELSCQFIIDEGTKTGRFYPPSKPDDDFTAEDEQEALPFM